MDAGDVLAASAIGLMLILFIYLTAVTVGVCIVYVIDFVWPDIKRFIKWRL